MKIFRICSHCNKEFELFIANGNGNEKISNFQDCTHCKKRNDVWVKVLLGKTNSTKGRVMRKDLKDVNECARMLYALQGNEVEKGYKFQKSSNHREQGAFSMAILTCDFWREKFKK